MGAKDTRTVTPGVKVASVIGMNPESATEHVIERIRQHGRNRCNVMIDSEGGLRVLMAYKPTPARFADAVMIGSFTDKTPVSAIRRAFEEKLPW